MDTAFKMLVSAIVAIALIMVLLNYILPYFLQTQDVEREIGVLLTEAEFSPGKYKSASIQLTSGANLRAENFDSDNRSVAFSCNSAELCLDYISYDEREMKVKRNIQTTASARCAYAHDLFTCKIYFGKVPAQLEIREAQVKGSIDLGKNESIAKFVVKNTGDVEARDAKATAKIYRRYFADFEWKKEFVRQNEKALGNIDAGSGINAEIGLPIEEEGTYAVEIIASAEDAGFDSAEKTFEAIGAINLCETTTQEGYATYNSESDKCRRKSFCESCTYAFECRDAWKAKSAGRAFESAEPGFAYEIREAFNDDICMVTELS